GCYRRGQRHRTSNRGGPGCRRIFSRDRGPRRGERPCSRRGYIAASHQGRAIFQRVDVTDRASVSAAIDACRRQFGSIKVMVNNAGFNKPEPFLEASEATWRKIMDVNALGVMIGIQEAAKAMIAAGTKGKIINTASIAGRTGYADFAPYCASKFAVVALTHAGARALA